MYPLPYIYQLLALIHPDGIFYRGGYSEAVTPKNSCNEINKHETKTYFIYVQCLLSSGDVCV